MTDAKFDNSFYKENDMRTLGQTLAMCRKELRYKQGEVSRLLKDHFGMDVSVHSLSHWEKDAATPNARQFLALCELYEISNMNETFNIYPGHSSLLRLSDEGREKVYEFIRILVKSHMFDRDPADILVPRRKIRKYHLRASAGTGQYLDSDSYDEIEVGDEVSSLVDFGVTLTGNSMEPQFVNGQTVWVHSQEFLNSGEIGIFYYNEDAYCKKYMEKDGKVLLISLNPSYDPIEVNPGYGFKIFGKVVG